MKRTCWFLCAFLSLLVGCVFSSENTHPRRVLFMTDMIQLAGSEQAFISLMNGWSVPNTEVEILLKRRNKVLEGLLHGGIPIISLSEASGRSYDVVVSYVHWLDPRTYLLKMNAKRRAQWIHIDLLVHPSDVFFRHKDKCNGIDAFVFVSEQSAESARKIQPQLKDKIFMIHNVFDEKLVRAKAQMVEETLPKDGLLNVVSMGRLVKQKGFDRAVKIHDMLNREGFQFRWYILGEGADRAFLEKKIKEFNLEGKFILLGQKMNPYPYIAQADIFALPSRYEGCSVAVNEAKALSCPILFTDVAGAREQIDSEVNGLLVPNNTQGIYEGLKRLLQEEPLRKKFSHALNNFTYDNQPIYDQIEKVLFSEDASSE